MLLRPLNPFSKILTNSQFISSLMVAKNFSIPLYIKYCKTMASIIIKHRQRQSGRLQWLSVLFKPLRIDYKNIFIKPGKISGLTLHIKLSTTTTRLHIQLTIFHRKMSAMRTVMLYIRSYTPTKLSQLFAG